MNKWDECFWDAPHGQHCARRQATGPYFLRASKQIRHGEAKREAWEGPKLRIAISLRQRGSRVPGVCITGAKAADAHARSGGPGEPCHPGTKKKLKKNSRATDRAALPPLCHSRTLTHDPSSRTYMQTGLPLLVPGGAGSSGSASPVRARNHEAKPFDPTANHRKMAPPVAPVAPAHSPSIALTQGAKRELYFGTSHGTVKVDDDGVLAHSGLADPVSHAHRQLQEHPAAQGSWAAARSRGGRLGVPDRKTEFWQNGVIFRVIRYVGS